MKILSFSDNHGSMKALEKLKGSISNENPDIIICAGDISQFENNIMTLLKTINDFGKPVIIVHGNHESVETFSKIKGRFKNIFYVHNSSFYYETFVFIGFGGGGFSAEDIDFKKHIEKFETIIKNNKDKKIIMVTHGPPYGTKIDMINGNFSGSRPLRKFIEGNEVELLVCGHIHENSGKVDSIGKTKVVNPGKDGKVLVI